MKAYLTGHTRRSMIDSSHGVSPFENAAIRALCVALDEKATAHARVIDEQIEMGWGSTPQGRIPRDWRTRRGPEFAHSAEAKIKMRLNRREKVTA